MADSWEDRNAPASWEYKQRLAEAAQAYRQALYAESRLPERDRMYLADSRLSVKISLADKLYAEATGR